MKEIAITCYVDNNKDILNEFKWLYKSWIISGSFLFSDMVVFYNPAIDCSVFPKETDIVYIPLQPLTEKDSYWSFYPFINNVYFLTTPDAGYLAKYKCILKTDCDCFLTPYFKDLKPRLTTFGAGQFAHKSGVVVRLALIAERWGIKPIFNNVGSSVMGMTNQVMTYSQIQLNFCKKLNDEEFESGDGTWPNWYRGVLSMYAGQLAAQSYFGYAMNIGGLDCHCMSHDPISPQDYHIHAWHSYDHFSKFKWRKGEYKDYDMSKIDRTRLADYCLYIAGKGDGCE